MGTLYQRTSEEYDSSRLTSENVLFFLDSRFALHFPVTPADMFDLDPGIIPCIRIKSVKTK